MLGLAAGSPGCSARSASRRRGARSRSRSRCDRWSSLTRAGLREQATMRRRRSRRWRPSRWASSPGSASPAWRSPAPPSASLLLALRQELHGFVERLDDDDVKALARYAVIAGAVLPFLPNGHYGPLGAWNPQQLWLVVVLVTGFSFLGYVANRIFGERHGTIATALIGGAYSSTAVTQSLAQRLGSEERGRRRARRNRACNRGHVPARVRCSSAVFATRVLPAVRDHCCCPPSSSPGPRVCGSIARRRNPMRRARRATRSRSCPRSASSRSSPWPRSPRHGPQGGSARAGSPCCC